MFEIAGVSEYANHFVPLTKFDLLLKDYSIQ